MKGLIVVLFAVGALAVGCGSSGGGGGTGASGVPSGKRLDSLTDAEKAVRQFVSIGYDRPIQVVDGVTVTFRDAGHILGSAQVILDVREGGRKFRYLFSGDVGRGGDEILRDPQPVEDVDGAPEPHQRATAAGFPPDQVMASLGRQTRAR